MTKRHTRLPRLWLMTDVRMGKRLIPAVKALPKGAGVIFRHYEMETKARRALLCDVERIARARRLTLVVAGEGGKHGRFPGAITAPVHSVRERIEAERAGVQLLLVSPVFSTSSHLGAKPLGRVRFAMLIRQSKRPVIALGGMNARRARSLAALGIYGWAGIDAFTKR